MLNYKKFCESVDNLSKYSKTNTYFTEEQGIEYIKNNCTEWLKNPLPIQRIFTNTKLPSFTLIDPKKFERKSINDIPNIYTLIIDNTEPWKNYPKRKNSLICSLYNKNKYNINEMVMNDNEYLIIPKDKSNWGVCKVSDIWWAFRTNINNKLHIITKINKLMEIFKKICDKLHVEIKDNNFNEFKIFLKRFKDKINNIDIEKSLVYSEFFIDERDVFNFLKNSNDILKDFMDIVYPNKDEFVNVNYNGLININDIVTSYEIWTDSECIAININDINKIDFIKNIMEENGY